MQDNNPAPLPPKDNVIRFEKRSKPQKPTQTPQHPPLINLPPATKYLTGAIVLCQLLLWVLDTYVPSVFVSDIFNQFGFVAARWTGDAPFTPFTPLSLLTVNFLHGGWFHLIINAVTLVAFGAGIEKMMGWKRMLILFFLSSAIALLTHLAVSPHSMEPVIGASGGISGLFGAILVIMKHDGQLQGNNQRLLPMVVLWIALTIGFGMMGAPDGSSVAWVAHIGGFLGGIGIAMMMLKKRY